MSPHKTLPFLTLLTTFVLLGFTAGQDKEEEGFVALFNGTDLTGFKIAGGKNKEESFIVEDGAIKVTTKGGGSHVHTEKSYKNYVLRFDWKFLDKGGNSGCFVHIKGGHIEVQGWEPFHGEIMFADEVTTDKEAQKKTIKPGEWNTTEITSKDGELLVKVNGVQVSKGRSKRTEGKIGWQSEGARVLFKNIRIKETD